MVAAVTDATFAEETKDGLVLIDFWATWCGPCRMQAPILEQLAGEVHEDEVKILKMDVDDHEIAGIQEDFLQELVCRFLHLVAHGLIFSFKINDLTLGQSTIYSTNHFMTPGHSLFLIIIQVSNMTVKMSISQPSNQAIGPVERICRNLVRRIGKVVWCS